MVGVHDGDTITVIHNGYSEKIRLYGIDCPELEQFYGKEAKKATHEMLYGKTVEIEEVDKDRYGRTVGIVKIEGKNVSEELVKTGNAYVYHKYCNRPECQEWSALETKAKECGRGFWAIEKLVSPEEYRKRRAKKRPIKPRSGLMSKKQYETLKKHAASPKAMMSYEDYVYYYSQPHMKLGWTVTMPGVGIYDWPYEKAAHTFCPYHVAPPYGSIFHGTITVPPKKSYDGFAYSGGSGGSYIPSRSFTKSLDYSKPVHVRGYYRSDGTYVRSHTRRYPHR